MPSEIPYPQFAVVLNSFLIIFLDIVGEVVNRDVVVFYVLHDLKYD